MLTFFPLRCAADQCIYPYLGCRSTRTPVQTQSHNLCNAQFIAGIVALPRLSANRIECAVNRERLFTWCRDWLLQLRYGQAHIGAQTLRFVEKTRTAGANRRTIGEVLTL